MQFEKLLRFVGIMNIILTLFCAVNIQGRIPYLNKIVKTRTNKQRKEKKNNSKFNIDLCSVVYRLISFSICLMIGTTKL